MLQQGKAEILNFSTNSFAQAVEGITHLKGSLCNPSSPFASAETTGHPSNKLQILSDAVQHCKMLHTIG